jgi:hypothetical protein
MTLPVSEILQREVYTKELNGQTMVRKFVMWKTNKETDNEEFPAYVLHYTDFSPNRKDALARDVRVSSSRTQLEQIWDTFKTENIKGGWNRHEGAPVAAVAAPAKSETNGKAAHGTNGKHESPPVAAAPAEAVVESAPEPKGRKKAVKKTEAAEEVAEAPKKKAAKKSPPADEPEKKPRKKKSE